MKIIFYNPSYPEPVIRRYRCSYHAGENLYPVIELLTLAAVARDQGHDVSYVDCIAEKLNPVEGVNKILDQSPDIVISLAGLECFNHDLKELVGIKERVTGVKVGMVGYYPTLFPEKTIENGIDFVLLEEGEAGLKALLDGKWELPGIVSSKGNSGIVPKITSDEYNKLPIPAFDLIQPGLYREVGLGSPLVCVQFTHGCPFQCNYCVRTYGEKVVRKKVSNVLEELQTIHKMGVPYFRILDDTFNLNRKWVIDICKGMVDLKLNFKWSALSRVDTLDEEVLGYMRKAGCKRIFVGIESGSQRILDFYRKGYKVEEIVEYVQMIRKAGMVSVGFFMVGAPSEKWKDVKKSIDMQKRCKLDYVSVSQLSIYPGISLADEMSDVFDVDTWDGTNCYKDESRNQEVLSWIKNFYKAFYFSPTGVKTGLRNLIKEPIVTCRELAGMLRFIFSGNCNKTDGNVHL